MRHILPPPTVLPRLVLAAVVCLASCRPTSTPPAPPAGGAPMTAPSDQTFAELSFTLPAGFTRKDSTEEEVASPIPGAPPTVEHFRSYVDAAGRGIYFFHWDGIPVRDRGPMVVAEKWEATVGGEKATVSLTSTFFGREQRVLVAHFAGPAPKGKRYMIYTTFVDKAAFGALLASVRFVGGAGR
ncbi:MAG: hypothetical protein HY906_05410 [Deltaproteobacteria bacterium]|nr:hypothetical protein [Deltaproteobacteria bacterium]